MGKYQFKILCVIVFQACFGTVGDGALDRYISVILSLTALLILFINTKFKYCQKYKKINGIVFIYCLYNAINSILSVNVDLSNLQRIMTNTNIDYEPVSIFTGISYGLKIMLLFLFIQYSNVTQRLSLLFKTFCILFCLLLTINDVLMLVNGLDPNGSGYLLGNKFQVAYMHYWGLLLYILKNSYDKKMKIRKMYYGIGFCAIISIIVQCTTALIGSIILFYFLSRWNKTHKWIYNPLFALLFLLICSSFFFIFSNILDNSFVQYILVDILNEDPTLTGRMGIYQSLIGFLSLGSIWGYGLGNSHFILAYLFGVANAQNGILDVWIEQGLIGTFLFLCILFILIKHIEKNFYKLFTYPILAFIYTYIYLSSVEITLGINFMLLLAFLLPYYTTNLKIR